MLTVERIAFARDRMDVLVSVEGGTSCHLDPSAAAFLMHERPTLARHACLNNENAPLAKELESSSLAHVLEHLIIDFQAEDTQADFTFCGTTEWIDKPVGRARIQVNYKSDLAALKALKSACALLKEAQAVA